MCHSLGGPGDGRHILGDCAEAKGPRNGFQADKHIGAPGKNNRYSGGSRAVKPHWSPADLCKKSLGAEGGFLIAEKFVCNDLLPVYSHILRFVPVGAYLFQKSIKGVA